MTKLRSRSRTSSRRPAKTTPTDAPLPARRPIFLVGFMGAGKTVVGQALARKLGWRFLDLDDAIVEREGRAIAEIFRDDGETAFRQVETEVLSEVVRQLRGGPAVVAVGGGAFVHQRNATLLRRARVHVVFLDAPVEQLMVRCAGAGAVRPLFQDENQFRQLYEQRRARYMEADACIDTASLTVDEVADRVLLAVGLHGGRKSAAEV